MVDLTLREALTLIASQTKLKSNSDDPEHEHYLRLVLIGIAERALQNAPTPDDGRSTGHEGGLRDDQKTPSPAAPKEGEGEK